MSKQFYDSKKMFVEYTGYKKKLSYQEWMDAPEGSKAVLLYIQYFNEILSAYYKLQNSYPFIDEEESVETVLQYLVKNVDKIRNCPKRFNAGYIYTVAYNCLYCISHDRPLAYEKYTCESSNIIDSYDGEELNIFDSIPDENCETYQDDIERRLSNYFWSTIFNECTEGAKEVVRRMIGMESKIRFKKGEEALAKEELKEKLEMYKVYFIPSEAV